MVSGERLDALVGGYRTHRLGPVDADVYKDERRGARLGPVKRGGRFGFTKAILALFLEFAIPAGPRSAAAVWCVARRSEERWWRFGLEYGGGESHRANPRRGAVKRVSARRGVCTRKQ